MLGKAKPVNPLNGMHTAGIFSDMSIDGPEIGTLVLVVDRAKNLPNRKTIGKQDPYCAARLGKEAKKTTTDIRGGQTPKWDQELRFTVHDSPDYYQLKLSVFNDDKRTDLIGETWIDLRDIIIPGGGQSDQWHTLNCRGKYAGETRIEITYYDTRPRPEKAAAKPKPVASSPDKEGSMSSKKTPVKRRPLPSDPVTGQAPSPPVAPEPVQQTPPPRPQPNPPSGSFIPKQSPLQAVEYNTPPPARYAQQPDQYSPSPSASTQYATPPPQVRGNRELHPSYVERPRLPANFGPRSNEPSPAALSPVPPTQAPPEPSPPPMLEYRPSVEQLEQPPPPPAHRSRNNSGPSLEMVHRGSYDSAVQKTALPMRHDVLRNEAHRHSVSTVAPQSSYPGRPTYRPYDSAPDVANASGHPGDFDPHFEVAPPRHHSYDAAYDSHHRSLQPTVEDVPETWTPPKARSGHPRGSQYDERDNRLEHYQPPSAVVPLDYERRRSGNPSHYSSPAPLPPAGHGEMTLYGTSPGRGPSRDPRDYQQHQRSPSPNPYGYDDDHYSHYPPRMDRSRPDDADAYAVVPATLVPGSDRFQGRGGMDDHYYEDRGYEDRRQERRYTQPPPAMATPPRGRQHSEPPVSTYGDYPPQDRYPAPSRNYDRSPITYSSGPNTPSGPETLAKPRGISPSPTTNQRIKRKSVSPAPAPSPSPDGRRLSGVPFGPDSYDELNPSVQAAIDEQKAGDYTNAYGKIVTSDGREVDPSDHLPMDSWAPEPEPRQTSQPPVPDNRSRPSPAGAQPMPPAGGRRILRITARPQSMSNQPAPTYGAGNTVTDIVPASQGRNRLQKKAHHRVSAAPAPIPAASSSPLGPATSHQRNSTPPRALVRANTFDYENYAPPYGGNPGMGGPRSGFGNGPPIPAKVPMMSGGLGPEMGAGPQGGGGGEEWALMQEMSRIDIGSGRARRHGGY